MAGPIPDALEIDSNLYNLLEIAPGRRQWQTEEVDSQPGDGGAPIPYPLAFHGGFGATRRFTNEQGQPSDPTHHDRAQNVDTRNAGILAPAPRITFLDLSTLSSTAKAFVLGGDKRSRLGGETAAGLGGGTFLEVPQAIEQFGDFLYIHAGVHSHIIDPAETTPSLKETRVHAAGARARSAAVFDNKLAVALGSGVDAEVATLPYTADVDTAWTAAAGVQMSAYKTGPAGRLFSAQDNKVFNVLAGQDPATLASYLPTAGEVITDETDPVRSLETFTTALVAGTAKTLRTFDPDRGFRGVSLLPTNRLSTSDYDGRALINLGDGRLLYATGRAVWLFQRGREPVLAGPELLQNNESPYIGGQPGVPDFVGDWIIWPWHFTTSGDSVIFWVRERKEGEPGTGPLVWADELYLSSREARVVRFWGGTSTVKPRVFFGAGTTAIPEQVGWVDVGRGGGPDLFDSAAVPAISSTLFGSHDDLGKPSVIKEVERVELPFVENADATNYFVVSVSDDIGVTYKDLHKAQSGSNQDRVNSNGAEVIYAQTSSVPAGTELGVRVIWTQASGATTFSTIRGTPMMYISERPTTVEQVTTLLEVKGTESIEDAIVEADRLKAFKGGGKVLFRHGPGDTDFHAKIVSARGVEAELKDDSGRKAGNRIAIELRWRVVATA